MDNGSLNSRHCYKAIYLCKAMVRVPGRAESVLNDLKSYNQKIRQDLSIEYRDLRFYTTWGLFSPRAIDDGSRLLLDYLELEKTDDCLDLGCGYGVLGLCMAKLAPHGHTLMVDKDFVAVDYAEKNRVHNRIDNASCILSNGFEQVPTRQFDVIVSNIPAKVGKELLYIYLFDALKHLQPGGSFYIVTITGLRQFFKRGFNEVFGHYEKIKQGKTYTVARGIKQSSR
jgi:16S rRNA G1207 methylase RsmC